MRKAKEFSNRITSRDLTSTNVKPHVADMPQVQPLLTDLEALIPAARSLDGSMEVARSQARDLTQQRHAIEKQGENLRPRTCVGLTASPASSSSSSASTPGRG
jgi:hypothetical protein